jgi:hypothetical protein
MTANFSADFGFHRVLPVSVHEFDGPRVVFSRATEPPARRTAHETTRWNLRGLAASS